MLTSAFGWAFDGAGVAHEIDHERRVVALHPAAHLDLHDQAPPDGEADLDAATHLYLHAVGHVQPFCVSIDLPAIVGAGSEVRTVFVPAFVPESIRDPLLRPPRSTLAS